MPLPLIAAPLVGGAIATAGRYLFGYMILRAVALLGIALVTYGTVDTIGTTIASHLSADLSGLGGDFSNIAISLGIADAVNVCVSAYISAITIRTVMGAYSKITFSKGS